MTSLAKRISGGRHRCLLLCISLLLLLGMVQSTVRAQQDVSPVSSLQGRDLLTTPTTPTIPADVTVEITRRGGESVITDGYDYDDQGPIEKRQLGNIVGGIIGGGNNGNQNQNGTGGGGGGIGNILGGIVGDLTANIGGGLLQGILNIFGRFARQAAQGVGKGAGRGAAVGLGLQPPTTVSAKDAMPSTGPETEQLGEVLGYSLTESFLKNQTFFRLLGALNVPLIASAVARGFVAGAKDGITAIGGLNAIANGTTRTPVNGVGGVAVENIEFDDSLGGSAVALAQGFGASLVVVVQMAFTNNSGNGTAVQSQSPVGAAMASVGNNNPSSTASTNQPVASTNQPVANTNQQPSINANQPLTNTNPSTSGTNNQQTSNPNPLLPVNNPISAPGDFINALMPNRRLVRRRGDVDNSDDEKEEEEEEEEEVYVASSSPLLVRRQLNISPNLLDLTGQAAGASVSSLAQMGVDVLTCDGVAGLLLLARGLQKSGTLPQVSIFTQPGFTSDVGGILQAIIPRGSTLRVTSGGNKYEIDGTKLAEAFAKPGTILIEPVTINGSSGIKFVVLLVLHIALAVIGLLILLPLAFTIASLQSMAGRLRVNLLLKPWLSITAKLMALVCAPIVLLTLIFGIVSAPPSGHFRTAHGILGLITVLISFAAIILFLFFTKRPTTTPPRGGGAAPSPRAGTSGFYSDGGIDENSRFGGIRQRLVDARSRVVDNGGRLGALMPWVSYATSQLLLVGLLIPVTATGLMDLDAVALCLPRAIVPFELLVLAGAGLFAVIILALYVSGAEVVLLILHWRTAGKADGRATIGGARPGGGGGGRNARKRAETATDDEGDTGITYPLNSSTATYRREKPAGTVRRY